MQITQDGNVFDDGAKESSNFLDWIGIIIVIAIVISIPYGFIGGLIILAFMFLGNFNDN